MKFESSQSANRAPGEPRPGAECATSRPDDMRKVVHDLRNVVAPLRNAVQLLRFRSKADDSLTSITDIIDRQINEMIRMLNALADTDKSAEAAEDKPAMRDLRAVQHSQSSAGRRVLIVDDNVALLTSLSSVLREAGHGVQTAEDGAEALALAASWNPEIVLLDADMPRMNGFEVAKQLRAKFSRESMKLVLMSGSTLDEATRRGAERAGFDHCIDKIHSFSSLDSVLRN
jgi:CheY-like chemotaxis protein